MIQYVRRFDFRADDIGFDAVSVVSSDAVIFNYEALLSRNTQSILMSPDHTAQKVTSGENFLCHL